VECFCGRATLRCRKTKADFLSFAQEINAKGAFLLGRRMAQLSSSREVTLINTGTAASYFANPGQSSYTASKAVANMLLDQLHAGKFLAAVQSPNDPPFLSW
jgi:NAD(P)-dependent dehydrogenase (short-subunit alcohol dehydrogenase family)